jgi:hypothetical protein
MAAGMENPSKMGPIKPSSDSQSRMGKIELTPSLASTSKFSSLSMMRVLLFESSAVSDARSTKPGLLMLLLEEVKMTKALMCLIGKIMECLTGARAGL